MFLYRLFCLWFVLLKTADSEVLRAARLKMGERMKGFTLIELLVVVLIVGILASVALPQYEVAVRKAKLTRLLPFLRAYKNVQEVYFMANGIYADQAEVLDIAPPAGCQIASSGHIYCPQSFYDNDVDRGLLYVVAYPIAFRGDNSIRQAENGYVMWLEHSGYTGEMACLAQPDSAIAEKVCKSLGGIKDSTRHVFFGQDVYLLPH